MNSFLRGLLVPGMLAAYLSAPSLLLLATTFAVTLLMLRVRGRALLLVAVAAALLWAAPYAPTGQVVTLLHVAGVFVAGLSITLPLAALAERHFGWVSGDGIATG